MGLFSDCRTDFNAQAINRFLGEVSGIVGVSEKLLKVDDYVGRLEGEMMKIDAFKRDLPFCFLLVSDAITTLKKEAMQLRKQTAEPIFEEFIPLKRGCDGKDVKIQLNEEEEGGDNDDNGDKKNWLSSAQLWNSDANLKSTQNQNQNPVVKMKERVEDLKKGINDEALKPSRTSGREIVHCNAYPLMCRVRKDKDELPFPSGVLGIITPDSNLREEDLRPRGLAMDSKTRSCRAASCSGNNPQSNLRVAPLPTQQQTSSRKQRRCWSPELHRRFVSALQQLGSPQAATPKQIRELMRVDGLTNDEVKSHLQKYRLHNRRLPSTTNRIQSVRLAGESLWLARDQYSESSKQSDSHSGSPQGPLQLTQARGTATMGRHT